MSGGELFVLDADAHAARALNGDMAGIGRIDAEAEARLKALIAAHGNATASPLAARILADWAKFAPRFVRIVPKTVLAAEAANTDVRLAQPA
ncbi:Ferredoxin-dependent glutamate synthase 2 [compost metagenome]